jgi:hypothetical protein
MEKVYISRQQARSLADDYSYYKAKRGNLMLVWWGEQLFWLGYVIPHGFYVVPFQHEKGQSQQLAEMVA